MKTRLSAVILMFLLTMQYVSAQDVLTCEYGQASANDFIFRGRHNQPYCDYAIPACTSSYTIYYPNQTSSNCVLTREVQQRTCPRGYVSMRPPHLRTCGALEPFFSTGQSANSTQIYTSKKQCENALRRFQGNNNFTNNDGTFGVNGTVEFSCRNKNFSTSFPCARVRNATPTPRPSRTPFPTSSPNFFMSPRVSPHSSPIYFQTYDDFRARPSPRPTGRR